MRELSRVSTDHGPGETNKQAFGAERRISAELIDNEWNRINFIASAR